MVSISKTEMEIVQGVTGVLIGMLDKKYGLIKFNRGTETCIALFSMDALFKDGYPYRKFFIEILKFDICSMRTHNSNGPQKSDLNRKSTIFS